LKAATPFSTQIIPLSRRPLYLSLPQKQITGWVEPLAAFRFHHFDGSGIIQDGVLSATLDRAGIERNQ
jgi:hypothetical protein